MKLNHFCRAVFLFGFFWAACQADVPADIIHRLPPQTNPRITIETLSPADRPQQLTLTPEKTVITLWISPFVEANGFSANINQMDFPKVDYPFDNSLRLEFEQEPGIENMTTLGKVEWIFAVATKFDSLLDGLSTNELANCWKGECQLFGKKPLIYVDGDPELFESALGTPSSRVVKIEDSKMTILEIIHQPDEFLLILPFNKILPTLKVLAIENQSPIHNDFKSDIYPLTLHLTLRARETLLAKQTLSERNNLVMKLLPPGNRSPEKLTVLAMTGVTALVRATAWKMETMGIGYPGRDIGDWLRKADITHISNEVSFFEKCPYPDPEQIRLFFCSRPKYIDLLSDVGADIVELTGNHNNDTFQVYGVDVTDYTLRMYQQRGMKYYGGGMNLYDARRAAVIEHNGNRFAFIGCNPAGPDYAWATEADSGAAPCGDLGWMIDEIRRLKSNGYIPIATFQYHENYSNRASETMRTDFRRMAEAGAVIVQGSQAHTPKEFEYYQDSFIHYGLGNLFFDQMHVTVNDRLIPGTRQEFIDMHVFYDGKHIATELLTAILEDYSKPRPMTDRERSDFLQEIFNASKPWIKN